MAKLTLETRGMTCGGCVRSVKSALERAANGAPLTVEIELESGRVVVDGGLSRDQARAAIEAAGFEVVGG